MPIILINKRRRNYDHVMPDTTVSFRENSYGDWVADVPEEHIAARLLSIPQSFTVYHDQTGATEIAPPVATSAKQPAPVEITTTSVESDADSSAPDQTAEKTDEAVDAQDTATKSPYVLHDEQGNVLVDLRDLDDANLRLFAVANSITIHHAAKGNTIRDRIVQALTE